ncbi:MAG TPA: TetR/AcrR family transcriptional regulator [Friedmanniella sp.]
MRQRKSEAVLSSARALFLDRGFTATTVDQIAESAHVSKATVYSNFEDKRAVLAALLERVASESEQILADVVTLLKAPGPVEARLERTAVALATGVLRPEVLQLRRLALTESLRFPAEVAAYYDHGPGSTLRLLERAFRDLDAEGLLVVHDPADAAARFAYSVVGPGQDRALLTGAAPSPTETARTASSAARAFFAAHRPD